MIRGCWSHRRFPGHRSFLTKIQICPSSWSCRKVFAPDSKAPPLTNLMMLHYFQVSVELIWSLTRVKDLQQDQKIFQRIKISARSPASRVRSLSAAKVSNHLLCPPPLPSRYRFSRRERRRTELSSLLSLELLSCACTHSLPPRWEWHCTAYVYRAGLKSGLQVAWMLHASWGRNGKQEQQ